MNYRFFGLYELFKLPVVVRLYASDEFLYTTEYYLINVLDDYSRSLL